MTYEHKIPLRSKVISLILATIAFLLGIWGISTERIFSSSFLESLIITAIGVLGIVDFYIHQNDILKINDEGIYIKTGLNVYDYAWNRISECYFNRRDYLVITSDGQKDYHNFSSLDNRDNIGSEIKEFFDNFPTKKITNTEWCLENIPTWCFVAFILVLSLCVSIGIYLQISL